MTDQTPINGRYPRRLFTHAFVPACPVHDVPMEKQRTGTLIVYFRCPRSECVHTGKAPRVEFQPAR